MAERDLYKILGVAKGAPDEDIKSAYRKLARKYHPDVNPGNKAAEEKFKQVAAAYDVLSSPEKRKLYDEFGEGATRGDFDPEKARAYRQWKSGRRATGHPFESESFEFDLGDLFGGAAGRGGSGGFDGFGGGPRRARTPQDIVATVELELDQALKGAEIRVQVPSSTPCSTCRGTGDKPGTKPHTCAECKGTGRARAVRGPLNLMQPCGTCGGTGKISTPCGACSGTGDVEKTEPVTVRIPAGADDGSRLRVPGHGARGDLVIETRVRPHPHFRREGLELYLKLPVTLDEAYNGASVEVPTPDGPVNLRIPPRSQNGAKLRLRGRGVARGRDRGNLYVELDVRLPDRDDARVAEALKGATAAYSRPVREGIRL